MMLPL